MLMSASVNLRHESLYNGLHLGAVLVASYTYHLYTHRVSMSTLYLQRPRGLAVMPPLLYVCIGGMTSVRRPPPLNQQVYMAVDTVLLTCPYKPYLAKLMGIPDRRGESRDVRN